VEDSRGMSTESFESFGLSDATQYAIDEDKAGTSIGGKVTGLGSLGSIKDSIYEWQITVYYKPTNMVLKVTYFATLATHEG
jgi:hypothetical protein